MKIKKSILRRIIREEAGHLAEGCPVDLPCPYAMADELKASGASPEELLAWVATLTQELSSPGDEPGADAEGVPSTLDGVSEPVSAPIGIALENRRRNRHTLSSRQLRRIIESVVGPGDLIRRPGKPVLPIKKKTRRPGTKRSSTLRKRR